MAIINSYTNQETEWSQLQTKGDCYATGGKFGYGTGAGSTVTQLTNRTTEVVINAQCGAITLYTTTGSSTPATFKVTNSTVGLADTVIVSVKSSTTNIYEVFVTDVRAGSFNITFFTTGGTTSDAPVFNFAVISGSLT